eukprot:jgi/Astpho2/2614/Aster-04317
MLVVEGQWVQPKWPAPPSQPRLKLPSSLWRQQLSGLMAAHPEWGHSQECRQQAVTALQQRHVADATKAFGQPGGSQLQQPQARVHQPAAQAGHSVQGPSGRWYHIMQLKPEPQPWCTFCQEHGHCTTACTPFAFSTLLGDDGRDPVTGEKLPLLAVQVPSVRPWAEEPARGNRDQQQLASGRVLPAERVAIGAVSPQQETSHAAAAGSTVQLHAFGAGPSAESSHVPTSGRAGRQRQRGNRGRGRPGGRANRRNQQRQQGSQRKHYSK